MFATHVELKTLSSIRVIPLFCSAQPCYTWWGIQSFCSYNEMLNISQQYSNQFAFCTEVKVVFLKVTPVPSWKNQFWSLIYHCFVMSAKQGDSSFSVQIFNHNNICLTQLVANLMIWLIFSVILIKNGFETDLPLNIIYAQ